MDLIAHVLWAYILFPESEYKFLALIFAVVPDITTGGSFLLYKALKGQLFKTISYKKGTIRQMPSWMLYIFKLFHSLLIVLILAGIFYLIGLPSVIIFYVFGSWLFHIAIDIFTHDATYLKTHFLFPFSNFTITGINSAAPKALVINYILIAIGLIIKLA